MTLPAGVLNRPPLATPRPVVMVRVAAIAGRLGFLLLPLVLLVALQAPAVFTRWRLTRLDRDLTAARAKTFLLEAERARLLDPRRLSREGRRLGLEPPGPGSLPRLLPGGAR